ncbi:MAG: chemotaxis protein CheX [Deltaproteobacteria bacterium]|nr:chemotaxis protein CheX [Deltaproteobacteria bacterium]
MKNKDMTTAMKNSISEVLETMFFLSLDFFHNDADIRDLWTMGKDQIVAAKLNFSGPLSGYAIFCIPKKSAVSITADFMGKDEEEISDDQTNGTVKEIINMIIGNTFSRYDPDIVFDLGVPELVAFNDFLKEVSDSEKRFSVVIETLENYLAFQMNIKNA